MRAAFTVGSYIQNDCATIPGCSILLLFRLVVSADRPAHQDHVTSMPEKAFVHALYGCACANPANLGFVLLTHLVLRHHNTSAKLLVYHGPERACAPDRLRRVLVEPDVHFRPLAPYEALSTSKVVHGPGQIRSKPPSADWINTWLPKVSLFKAMRRDFVPGARIVFLDADAVPTSGVEELFTMPLPASGCLLAADPLPTYVSNSGVLVCELHARIHDELKKTFDLVGSSLGESDQELISYHMSRHEQVQLHARYNVLVPWLGGRWNEGQRHVVAFGRNAVAAFDPAFIKIVHYTGNIGDNTKFGFLQKVCRFGMPGSRYNTWGHALSEHCALQGIANDQVVARMRNLVGENDTDTQCFSPRGGPRRTNDRVPPRD